MKDTALMVTKSACQICRNEFKIGTRCALMNPLCVPSFNSIRKRVHVFLVENTSVQNEDWKKNKESKNKILLTRISGLTGVICFM